MLISFKQNQGDKRISGARCPERPRKAFEETASEAPTAAFQKRRRAKKKNKRKMVDGPARKPIPDEDGGHTALGVQWIDQLSISAGDKSHREAGLWAFETYDPNAMRGANEHMAFTAADFVMFQETKVARVSVKDVESSTSNSGWRMSL